MNDTATPPEAGKPPSEEAGTPDPTARRFWFLPKPVSLKAMREYIVNLSFFTALILVGLVAYKTLTDKTIRINPIEVPSDLAGKGFTRDLVPKRIADEIRAIQIRASTIKEGSKLAPDLGEIEIQIPGAKVSVSSLVDQFGTFLGFEKREISGEITRTDTAYAIRLRMPSNGAVIDIETDADTAESVNKLIRDAARRVLATVDPFMMSAYHYSEREYDQARAHINQTLERESQLEKAWALNLLGVIEAGDLQTGANRKTEGSEDRSQDFALALGHVALAIELQPDFALPYLTRGNINQHLGNFEQANEAYAQAAKLNPNLPNLHRNWGMLLVSNRKLSEAIEILKRGWEHRPQDTSIGHKLAERYFLGGKVSESISVLKAMKQQKPNDAVIRHILAVAYEGRDESSMNHERAAAARLDPDASEMPEYLK